MSDFGKRRGYIISIEIGDGVVLCDVEDADTPDQNYPGCIYGLQSASQVVVPPAGAEVIVEKIGGEKIITHTLSVPPKTNGDEGSMEAGANNNAPSMTFVFGSTEPGTPTEGFSIEYRDGGYVFDLDIEGSVTINAGSDVTIDSGGDVTIKEGGTAKKVLTEDAVFEYEDTGDTSDGTATAQKKKTSKVSNGETTDVELQ